MHGVAVLYDCHSIRSHIPFLFEGKLPDFNVGTDDGRTCSPEIEAAAVEWPSAAPGYTSVLNGRFKGGWTTRHYGRPERESMPSRWNSRNLPICPPKRRRLPMIRSRRKPFART